MTTWGHLMLASLAGTRSASSEFFLQARAEEQIRGLQREVEELERIEQLENRGVLRQILPE